jgi:hypothetical protein
VKRASIRTLVALTACAAFAAFAWVPIPEDATAHPALPAVALEQPGLYRLEIALMVFYGGLLLITPAFSGLIEGRLPIEISARGARFAERADQNVASAEGALAALEQTTADLGDALGRVTSEVDLLKSAADDKRKPAVPSEK